MVHPSKRKQNLTISLSSETVQKAKVLAAQRSTSISALLAEQVEKLVGEEDAYRQFHRQALTLLHRGFHLGGEVPVSRDELHDR
jgi:hypothetical protein